jgi:hypothetical protein
LVDENKTVETLLANAKKIDKFLATNEPRMGKGKRPKEVQSNITDNQSAKMTTSTKSMPHEGKARFKAWLL